MLTSSQKKTKRLIDILLSLVLLVFTSWLMLFAWIVASIETRSNGMFSQVRIGMNGKKFKIFKIKTMISDSGLITSVTTTHDNRITRSGRFFRKTKIDELPQLWNVFVGEMSFVGPRPDVPGFADMLTGADKAILNVRPGITGPASLYYRDEEEILGSFVDYEKHNREVIFPHKTEINREYIRNYSLLKDFKYIWCTIKG